MENQGRSRSPTLLPPGKLPGNFFERANAPPLGTKKVRNPEAWGRKIELSPIPGAINLKNPAKNPQNMRQKL